MTTIITREIGASPKGSPLTNSEVDQNFINLNTDKAEKASPTFTGTVTLPTSLVNVTTSSYPTIRPSLNLDFANSMSVDPRITFTRASTATRVNANGLIEVVASGSPRIDFDPETDVCKGLLIEESRTNLLTYSENFDDASWLKSRSSVTSNTTTAPDGTLTADTFIEDTSVTNSHYIYQPVSVTNALVYTKSIYVKAKERSYCAIQFYGTNSAFASCSVSFDLITGTVTATSGAITNYSIVYIGNGWYRISASSTATATANGNISVNIGGSTPTEFNYTGDGTSGLYIWGAQLEVGAFPTSYIPSSDTFTSRASTATYVGSNGLIQSALTNVARYNYNPVNLSLAPKLLLESASTNLLTYSEQFDDASWTKNASTVSSNISVSPAGSLTADKLVEDATSNYHTVRKANSFTSGTAYTATIYAKAAERNYVTISAGNITTFSCRATFDLQTGTVASTVSGTASITAVGNGWYKCSVTGTAGATSSTGINFAVGSTGSYVTYTGDGYSGIYIWGAQLEASSFPTSYIPTLASQVTRAADISSSAQTTRVADTAVMTGTNFSSWYNQTEGTVLCNFIPKGSVASRKIWDLHNQSGAEYIELRYSSGAALQYDCANNSIEQWNIAPTGYSSLNTRYSHAASYKVNDIAASVNGSSVLTDSSASLCTPTQLSFGISYNLVSENLNGHISKLSYYPKRLTNSELQALTTG